MTLTILDFRIAILMRGLLFVRLIAATSMAAGAAAGQTAEAPPSSFEVASVKIAAPLDPAKLMAGQQRVGLTLDAARVDIRSLTLGDLIRTAYQVKMYQISGPAWIETERYDIVAKLPDGAKRGQIPAMLQALLAERFRMTVHRSTTEVPAFALVVAKGGPKLKASPPDPDPQSPEAPRPGGNSAIRSDSALDPKGVVTNSGPNGTVKQTIGPNGMHLDIQKMAMPALADLLGRFKARPVTDMTALEGKYDFVLDLSREELADVARASGQVVSSANADLEASDPNSFSLSGSLDLLGLKLETRKTSVQLLVIDHVEKTPIEN
jgi:uncharacterized protein (TIGR03435 family)